MKSIAVRFSLATLMSIVAGAALTNQIWSAMGSGCVCCHSAGRQPAGGHTGRPPVPSDDPRAGPLPQGQRVFSCGHSFHVFVPAILNDMAKAAGLKEHTQAGLSSIGGSRVIQHWDVPEEKNQAKEALRAGTVDVLTLSPIHLPDDGIEIFAALALEHNPKTRITVQEFWLPYRITSNLA